MVDLEQSVCIVRRFSATPDQLYIAWTDEDQRKRWLVPPTYRLSVCMSDPVTGGSWTLTLFDEDGIEHSDRGTWATLEPGENIETSWFYSTSSRPGEDESWLAVSFREVSPGVTEQTLIHARLPTPEQRSAYGAGWAENMDRLDKLVST